MPKRTREADADADTPVSEDTLKAAYKLFCRAYVSVSGEDVPACDQLKHHALWGAARRILYARYGIQIANTRGRRSARPRPSDESHDATPDALRDATRHRM